MRGAVVLDAGAAVRVGWAATLGTLARVGGVIVAVWAPLHATSSGTSKARMIPAIANRRRPSARRQSSIGPSPGQSVYLAIRL